MSEPQFVRRNIDGLLIDVSQPKSEERDTKTIAGKFAEALGCLEDALCWLGQVNEQYDPDYPNAYDPPPRNRAMDFWLQAELAEDALKGILRKLQRVEPFAPKEVAA